MMMVGNKKEVRGTAPYVVAQVSTWGSIGDDRVGTERQVA